MSPNIAEVQTLTAEVKALMIGNRQVTLSVYRQLDVVEPDEMDSFGRVYDSKADGREVWAVGRHRTTGALVKACRTLDPDDRPYRWNQPFDFKVDGMRKDWAVVGPHRGQWVRRRLPGTNDNPWGEVRFHLGDRECSQAEYDQIPNQPRVATLGRRGAYAVNVYLPDNPPVVDTIEPGGWTFADPESRAAATTYAEGCLDHIHGVAAQWEAWKSQPLIVLAGLR